MKASHTMYNKIHCGNLCYHLTAETDFQNTWKYIWKFLYFTR